MSNMPKVKKKKVEEEYITLGRLRRIMETLKESPDSTKISLQYVCSWFPGAWETMESNMKDMYTKGYIDGKQSNE